jgi:hypothetical protein
VVAVRGSVEAFSPSRFWKKFKKKEQEKAPFVVFASPAFVG